ncbi:MAG: SAM-dependent methyltransferase [Hellea sp.]
MSEAKAPPDIFDAKLLKLRRARAAKRPVSFLMERCLSDVADRLMDVNRNFGKVLIVGAPAQKTELIALLPPEKVGDLRLSESLETLPAAADYDLVISLLRLQSENDLPGAMIRLRQTLQPDGLFIAAMFGGETLSELRQVFYKTDEALLGGLAPHIYPMANYSQAAGLLTRAGLNQPVVDTDRFTVSYKAFETLISDLRDLGETNVLTARRPHSLPRGYIPALKSNYADLFSRGDKKLICSFEILWLTGWAPHESQQKPLKPGSAKMSLDEALNGKPRP